MTTIISTIIGAVLNWVLGKVSALISVFIKDEENHQAEISQANQDMAKTGAITDQSTLKEQEDAADDSLKHF